MLLLTEVFFAAIEAAGTSAGDRVYPLVAPPSPATPYVVYRRFGSQVESVLVGDPPIENIYLQVDCYAATYAAAWGLQAQVYGAIKASALKAVPLSEPDDLYEADVKLFRVMQEWSLWNR